MHVPEMVSLQHVEYVHAAGPSRQTILQDVSLSIYSGESCAITGPSGAGKSTLLSLIGLLDIPMQGRIELAGRDMSHASADIRAMVRNQLVGFVFQGFNLLPRLDAVNNSGCAAGDFISTVWRCCTRGIGAHEGQQDRFWQS